MSTAQGPAPGTRDHAGAGDPSPDRPVKRRLHNVPVIAVVAVLALGLVGLSLNHWRKGLMVMGFAPLLAAMFRLVLPGREAGLLAIRGRGFDIVLLTFVGVAVIVLAWVVPVYYRGPR